MSAAEGNPCDISVNAPAEMNTKYISKAAKQDRNGVVRQSERDPTNLKVIQFNHHTNQAQKLEKQMLEDTSGRQGNAIHVANPHDQQREIRARSSSSPTAPHQEHSSAAKAQHELPTPPVCNIQAMTFASLINTV